jgi:hypothetical protein
MVLSFASWLCRCFADPEPNTILSDKSISICNINIRSIRNKIIFFQNFVDEFDIIVLTETHLDNSIEKRDIELD